MPSTTPTPAGLWRNGLIFGALATVANLIVFGAARLVSGTPLVVPGWNGQPPQTVGALSVVVATLVPAVLAVVFGMLVARFLRTPRTVFVVVVGALTVLSAGAPLGSGADGTTVVALTAMHLLTGALIGYGVARALPARRAVATTP